MYSSGLLRRYKLSVEVKVTYFTITDMSDVGFTKVRPTVKAFRCIVFLGSYTFCQQCHTNGLWWCPVPDLGMCLVRRTGPSWCGTQCKTWALGPMQDLSAGPLWTVILRRNHIQSTVLQTW